VVQVFLIVCSFSSLSDGEMASAQSFDNDERVLCGDEWRVEAAAVIHDVRDHVQEITIAEGPTSASGEQDHIFLNLTTREMKHYCIELTAQGFRVVGNKYDQTDEHSEMYFETPYAMLDTLSPLYREAFGNSLASRLQELHTQRNSADGGGDAQ
jgi:Protein of unknown function (DUF727)